MPMAKIIGIDLGTTNSEAAYMEGGAPKIIPSAEGSAYGGKMFPSVVAFTKDGILVGEPAKRQAVLNPDKTVMQIKRKMGTDYKVRVEGKDYAPQEISAMVLRKIKADAEAFLGQKISQVVITASTCPVTGRRCSGCGMRQRRRRSNFPAPWRRPSTCRSSRRREASLSIQRRS